MKFLVLAFCVCAASAASFNNYGAYKPYTYPRAQAVAQVGTPVVIPVAKVAPVTPFVSAPVPVPVAHVPVAPAPVAPVQVTKHYVSVDADAQTLRQDSEVRPDGFAYAYETNNGIAAESNGVVKRVGDIDTVVVQGSYRYTSPEGVPVVFTYIADENGYQPQSDLLPVAPPVPEAIARSLAYIAEHPQYVEVGKKY